MKLWKSVFFKPWCGEQYGKTDWKRLLILGESHYDYGPPVRRNWTINMVRQYANGEWTYPFWTKIGQVFTGQAASEMDRLQFWNSVAFYNYIQEVLPQTRLAPSTNMFRGSVPAFFEVLRSLRPSHIVVLGNRLWNNMPDFESERRRVRAEHKESDCRTYEGALAIRIHHPASAFSPAAWHPLVTKFLAR